QSGRRNRLRAAPRLQPEPGRDRARRGRGAHRAPRGRQAPPRDPAGGPLGGGELHDRPRARRALRGGLPPPGRRGAARGRGVVPRGRRVAARVPRGGAHLRADRARASRRAARPEHRGLRRDPRGRAGGVPMRPGGRPGNHGGCGERSGGCERRARSSLLRRAFRHASSVVAALAALAPRLVRLARHDYPDRLLASAPRRRAAVGALLVLAVAAEMGLPPGQRRRLPFGDEIPPAYGALARLPDRVVYDGRNGPEAIALGMYYAIFHRKAVPTGYSGFSPPAAGYVTQRLFRFPEDDALVLLDALGIRHVLWHFATPAAADAFLAGPTPPSLSVAGRFGGDVLFTLGEPPVLPPAAAVHPLARAGWRLTASAGGDRLPALVDGDPRSAWAAPVDRGRTPWVLVDLGR